MALNALKIQTADLVGKLVAQLSNRPTNPTSAGGDNLTAQEVKERYDAYGHLLKERFNALIDALVADPAVDTDALANYIKVYLGDPAEDDPLSLADALVALVTEIAKKYEKPEGGIPAADLASAVTTAIDGKYVKPGTGIPATDLETAVQTSLGKAETAYQKPASGIPASDLAEAIRTILTNAVSQSEFAPVKALAEGAEKAEAAENYSALASLLSAAEKTAYKPGQKFLIGTYGVPDVGVLSVEDTTVSYTYTTDAAFEASLMAGTLQIGYFVLRPVEGKTNLADYATTADLDALINALVDGVMAVAEATYAESATYAQQAYLANQINTDREIEDADTACPPAVFGTVGGNAEVQSGLMPFTEVHGNTIKWNQLINPSDIPATDTINGITFTNNGDGTVTVSGTASATAYIQVSDNNLSKIVGHKYFLRGCPTGGNHDSSYTLWDNQDLKYDDGQGVIYTASMSDVYLFIIVKSGTAISTPITFKPNYFDLTDIYGAGKEPATVAEFVRDFPLPYYAYNPVTLLSSKSSSVDFIKRNQWDEEWEVGGINDSTGAKIDVQQQFRSKNYILVLPNTDYFFVAGTTLYTGGYVYFYDANKSFIGRAYTTQYDVRNQVIKTPLNCVYVLFKVQMTSGTGDYKNEICFYINWETPNLPYVAYSKQHITLPNLELRSVGDVYDVAYQTGGGKRRIGKRAYQSGDENDFDVLTDGTTTLYVLTTETDITVEENPGWTEYAEIDNFGTVKFNQDPAQTIPVPQAYFIRYTVNLVEFLDSLYVHCGGDVSKIALVE